MPYASTITFTLDTICPWTYLARRRLQKALATIQSELSTSSGDPKESPVTFQIHYAPYQLFPEASQEGEDKRAWYLTHKYNGSEEQLAKYEALMAAYFLAEEDGEDKAQKVDADHQRLPFVLTGPIANTLPAHRLLQHVQTTISSDSPAATERLLEALYRRYFSLGAHPSSVETLLSAAQDAGLESEDVQNFIRRGQEEKSGDESWQATRAAIREQANNGVDAVPYVVIEGRRRDFTLVGCKSVAEYEKALRAVVKESS